MKWREPLVVLVSSFVVVAIWIVPKGFHPGARILGHPESDLTKHYWNLWWAHRVAVQDHALPFYTDYLNYPSGLALYPIEPLNQIAAIVAGGWLGFPWLTNILALFHLALAVLGMYVLVRYETGSRPAAVVAGLMYALGSYAVWTVYVGVGELSNLGWMPLALFAWLRVAREGGARHMAWAVVLFFVTAFSCWYYALFLYLFAGLLMIMDPWRGRRTLRLWGRYLVVLSLSLGAIFPIVTSFNQSYRSVPRSEEALGDYVRHRMHSQPHDNLSTRIDIKDLVLGGRDVRVRALRNPYQGGRFVGVVLLCLALGSLILRPRGGVRWVVCAAVMLTLGLGSRLVFGGKEIGGMLPFFVFNLGLERYAQAMNFPARFMMPLTLALVAAAGISLGALHTRLLSRGERQRVKGLVFLVLIGLLPLGEARWRGDLPLPLPSRSIEALPAGAWLRDHASATAVLEIPQAFQSLNRRACDEVLLQQVVHQRKSAALPIDRISAVVTDARSALAARPLVGTLLRLSGVGSRGPGDGCCEDADAAHPEVRRDRDWLIEAGFGDVVITWQGMSPEHARRLRRFCTRIFGPPVFDDPLQSVFRIRGG